MWNNWFLIALLNPVAWAFGCLLDVFLIDRKIYRSPIEPIVVSGLFCLLPLLVLTFQYWDSANPPAQAIIGSGGLLSVVNLQQLQFSGATFSILAGLGLVFHLYFYFKALFIVNDASKLETFNLLSVVLVPVLSFLLLREKLSLFQYAAIALATCGVVVLIKGSRSPVQNAVLKYSGIAVLAMSLSMIFLVKAYELAAESEVMIWYFLTLFCSAYVCCLLNPKIRLRTSDLFVRFFYLFILTEMIQLIAVFGSQRAIGLSGSASMVALVECALPLLIILFSVICLTAIRIRGKSTLNLTNILTLQITNIRQKSIALLLIGTSIGIIQWWNFN